MELEKFYYDNKIPRAFAIATFTWAIVGMLVGVIAAFQLAEPSLNLGVAQTTFGRLRPLHTNAVIFAFVGNEGEEPHSDALSRMFSRRESGKSESVFAI